MMENPKKLHLGCGEFKKAGYVNVDWQSSVGPDVVHDLNVLPYPFGDSEFDGIEAFHVLEHLDRPFAVMKELARILKPGGTLLLKVPHFSRGYSHAEHCHGFDITFPLYFNRNFTKSGFFGVEFELRKMKLRWLAFLHLLPYLGYGRTTIALLAIADRAVSFFANLSPAICSRLWCFWVGGVDEIEFEFVCKK